MDNYDAKHLNSVYVGNYLQVVHQLSQEQRNCYQPQQQNLYHAQNQQVRHQMCNEVSTKAAGLTPTGVLQVQLFI